MTDCIVHVEAGTLRAGKIECQRRLHSRSRSADSPVSADSLMNERLSRSISVKSRGSGVSTAG